MAKEKNEEKLMLLTVSRAKEVIKTTEMRCGEDFIEGLNDQVYLIITAAVNRCKANGRQTLKAEDI